MPRAGTTKQRGYGHAWRVQSQALIRAQPWCSVCGRRDDLTCDHIVPLARGGKGTRANMRVVCRSCNCGDRIAVSLFRRHVRALALVVSHSKVFEWS
jgi:5-methylcytosine-specific restriction endonuclease McrA